MGISFDEPDINDYSLHNRWKVKVAIYKTLLYVAGFEIDKNYTIKFNANEKVREKIDQKLILQRSDFIASKRMVLKS